MPDESIADRITRRFAEVGGWRGDLLANISGLIHAGRPPTSSRITNA